VKSIDAAEGKEVAADKPLLHLDDSAARLQADEASAALEAARVRLEQALQQQKVHDEQVKAQEAAVQSARASTRAAEIQLKQAQRRAADRAGSKEDAETAEQVVARAKAAQQGEEAKLDALKAQKPELDVRLAERDVMAREAALKLAQRAVDECVVKAPFAGKPLRVLVSVGQVVGPEAHQPALWFCPKGPRIIRAEVEQEFAGRVQKLENQPVVIKDDATGSGEWKGRVERIGDWYTQRRSVLHEPLQFNDVRTLECIIALNEQPAPGELRIGQRVRVIFQKSGGK
jgi:multidrug resistance efflux pump